MFGFGRRRNRKNRSKDTLKERLIVVLKSDRAQLSPQQMDDFKRDLAAVVDSYFPNRDRQIDVEVEHRDDKVVLTANLPVE